MMKKIMAVMIVMAASCGLLLADDSIAPILLARASLPSSPVNLAAAAAPSPADLRLDAPTLAGQPAAGDFSIPNPYGGFRRPATAGKALFELNLLAMVGLNVADYISTRQALKCSGLYEANPLMQPFVKSPAAFAAVKFGTTALTYLSFRALYKKNRTVAWVLTTASNVLLSYVVANNFQQIRGARVTP